jgi:hypothetical protein
MSILSNLVLNCGSLEASSLFLCQSPKEQNNLESAKDRLSCDPRLPVPDRDRTSRSLSKLDVLAKLGKVDPKQRILHRIVYKMEMKCRKLYFNVFVKIENYAKKAAISLPKVPKPSKDYSAAF